MVENFYVNGRGPDSIYLFCYGADGTKCEEGKELAKVQTINGKDIYFLPFIGGDLIDSANTLFYERNRKHWVFKQVGKKCFDTYVGYLKTKKQSSLTIARRLINEPK